MDTCAERPSKRESERQEARGGQGGQYGILEERFGNKYLIT